MYTTVRIQIILSTDNKLHSSIDRYFYVVKVLLQDKLRIFVRAVEKSTIVKGSGFKMGASNGQFSFSYHNHHRMTQSWSFSVVGIFDFASCQIHVEDEILGFLQFLKMFEFKHLEISRQPLQNIYLVKIGCVQEIHLQPPMDFCSIH